MDRGAQSAVLSAQIPLRRLNAAWLFLLLIAFGLRLPGLFSNSFHADEALFASWTRHIATGRDVLLLTQPVDKPPLLFYLQALFYPLFGPVEWAARLPNFLASLSLVPLTGRLAQRLSGGRSAAGVVAGAIVALSPLAIQFSPTAFTDPLLTVLLTAALWRVAEQRPFSAGLLFGLAAATKYQAWLFLPLLAGLALLQGWRRRDWGHGLAGLAAALLPLLFWTQLPERNGLVSAQWRNFGGLRLSWPWELLPRLAAWGRLLPYLAGPALLLTALPFLTRRRRAGSRHLLALFLVAYGLSHWLLAVPTWDRYLLPLAPLVAVLAGWGAVELWSRTRLLTLLVILLLLPGGWGARNGRFPIGGGRTADQGAAQVAAWLADARYGTVLYDHWYSWQWRYHLFDRRVYVSWFPHPAALTEDLAVFGRDGAPRYLALPAGDAAGPVKAAVAAAGFHLVPRFQSTTNPGMILYQIVP